MWDEVFAHPGTETEVEVDAPTHNLVCRGEFSGFSTPRAWPFTAEVTEMSDGEAAAWGRDDGWAAARTLASALGSLLGGELTYNSYRWSTTHEERHSAVWLGKEVEL